MAPKRPERSRSPRNVRTSSGEPPKLWPDIDEPDVIWEQVLEDVRQRGIQQRSEHARLWHEFNQATRLVADAEDKERAELMSSARHGRNIRVQVGKGPKNDRGGPNSLIELILLKRGAFGGEVRGRFCL